MIEVKGTRSTQPAPPVADPLNLRHPEVLKSHLVGSLLGGILVLAVYLRSFLWPAPAADAPMDALPPAAPKAAAGGGLRPIADADAPPSANDDGASRPPSITPLPAVSGPFTTGIFAPFALSALPFVAPAGPANSALPTFPAASFPDRPAAVAVPITGPATPHPANPDPAVGDVASGPPVGHPVGQPVGHPPTAPAPPRNRAPHHTGPVHLGEVGSGAALAIAMSSLLSNSTDADADPLVAAQTRASAGALLPRSGGLLYIADTDQLGPVQISFQVTDGSLTTVQTATLTVIENLQNGTDDADLLRGTAGRDRILAAAGDDDIAAFDGRDVIYGGAGDDNIAGGSGRDTLYGDQGDDLVAGGADADLIFGGAGDDRLHGEAGDDHLQGDAGNDVLDGGSGNDALLGGTGNDTATGGAGDDLAAGGQGDDSLSGDAGADVLFGDEGHDTLSGGTGADIIFGGQSDDWLDGGADDDLLAGDAGNDTVDGGAGADIAAGGTGDDVLHGGLGDDALLGEDGDDTLSGGSGADTLSGGQGSDLFIGETDAAPDVINGGDGIDRLDYAALSEEVTFDLITQIASGTGTGQDSFTGIEAFAGGSGDDVFVAIHGTATLTGNAGSDTFGFRQGDTLDLSHPSFRITDFELADMISLTGPRAGLALRKAQKDLEDRIDGLFDDFADRIDADEPKLRYFHEWAEDYRRTVVEVDFDRDNTSDLTLTLDGAHLLDLWRPLA